MKGFSSILALYMLALFMMPCADTYGKDLSLQPSRSTEIPQDNHDHTETQDLCTPFCLCGCCGLVSGVVLQWGVADMGRIRSFDLSKPKMYHKPAAIPCYFGDIWQPPKINV